MTVVEMKIRLFYNDCVMKDIFISGRLFIAISLIACSIQCEPSVSDEYESNTPSSQNNQSDEECIPDCENVVCGDDGCGGSCGGCATLAEAEQYNVPLCSEGPWGFSEGDLFPNFQLTTCDGEPFSPINYVSPTPPWSFSFAGGECPARSLPVGQAQPRTSMTKMTFRSWLLFRKTNSMNPRPLNIAKR